jgi:hypothetical protein
MEIQRQKHPVGYLVFKSRDYLESKFFKIKKYIILMYFKIKINEFKFKNSKPLSKSLP